MMGGLGGFFPPLVITYVTGLTGSSHLAFILLAIFGVLAFITMGHLYKKNMQNKFIEKEQYKAKHSFVLLLTFYSCISIYSTVIVVDRSCALTSLGKITTKIPSS